MPTARRSLRRSRSIRTPDLGRSGAPAVGAISGLVLIVAVFLPWYAVNLGPPFSATSASGWHSTDLARIAALMGLVLFGAAAAALLDERGVVSLERRHGDLLGWIAMGAGAIALVVVGYRLIWMPSPAEFLSRQIGIYLAILAAVGGVLSGLGQVATRV